MDSASAALVPYILGSAGTVFCLVIAIVFIRRLRSGSVRAVHLANAQDERSIRSEDVAQGRRRGRYRRGHSSIPF